MDGHRPTRERTIAQRSGDAAEALVAARLVEAGWTVVARNVRLGRKELDILAIDPAAPATLVIVEVRWRARRDFGLPEETFDHRKRGHLRAALGRLLQDGLSDGRRLPALPVRIDLVTVEPPPAVGGEPLVRHHRAVG